MIQNPFDDGEVNHPLSDWELVKRRTAAEGAVWFSPGERAFKRTGGPEVAEEGEQQLLLADMGYPVPRPTAIGVNGGLHFFVEPSAGQRTLHDLAVAHGRRNGGRVNDDLVDRAAAISTSLLWAQAQNPIPATRDALRSWFWKAGSVDDVFSENPDLDIPAIRSLIDTAVDRVSAVPMCRSHLDYGLPNVFDGAVIDWQHHAPAPLGYDVYPMLDIAAFKGGGKGYALTPGQRARFTAALDAVAGEFVGQPLSSYQGDFLLAKCFFFLARMRPKDDNHGRPDKHRKWLYRRELFTLGIGQYAKSRSVDTGAFPKLDDFESHPGGSSPRP